MRTQFAGDMPTATVWLKAGLQIYQLLNRNKIMKKMIEEIKFLSHFSPHTLWGSGRKNGYITWEAYGNHRELRRAKIEKLILLFLVGGFTVFAGLQAILK